MMMVAHGTQKQQKQQHHYQGVVIRGIMRELSPDRIVSYSKEGPERERGGALLAASLC